jgi:hypothetical protein
VCTTRGIPSHFLQPHDGGGRDFALKIGVDGPLEKRGALKVERCNCCRRFCAHFLIPQPF